MILASKAKIVSLCLSVLVGWVGPAAAQNAGFWGTRSDQSFVNSHMGVGGTGLFPVSYGEPYLGFEAYATLRPTAAKYFYPRFERLNVGMSLALTYLKIDADEGFVNADVVFRKYFTRMERRLGEDSAFVGAGFGVLGVFWEDDRVGYQDVSLVAEIGYEYRSVESLIVTVKAQSRHLEAGPVDFSGVAVVLTLGWRVD